MFSISILMPPKESKILKTLLDGNDIQLSIFNNRYEITDDTVKNTELLILPYEMDGETLLPISQTYRHTNPHLLFIFVVDEDKALHSINAFKSGAFDVLTLPFDKPKVHQSLARIKNYLKHRNHILSQRLVLEESSDLFPIAISKSMTHMINQLHQIADKDVPVLFIGETGTGKNIMANYLHNISKRQESHFLTVNCGAISPSLLESELFGHEKGSFTGALSRRIGLLEAADGGTLFLDEINSAPPELQVRLLQFIQDKKLLRVGARTEVSVNVQLIFATNQPLKELVDKGEFREDLYFRLNVFPINIPPLRDRVEDISHLAARFLFKHAPKIGKNVNSCGPGVLDVIQKYSWPGNVRELENVIIRALLICTHDRIELKDLPPEITSENAPQKSSTGRCIPMFPDNASLKEIEHIWIQHTLKKYKGNKLRASKTLGINPATLWRKMQNQPSVEPEN